MLMYKEHSHILGMSYCNLKVINSYIRYREWLVAVLVRLKLLNSYDCKSLTDLRRKFLLILLKTDLSNSLVKI